MPTHYLCLCRTISIRSVQHAAASPAHFCGQQVLRPGAQERRKELSRGHHQHRWFVQNCRSFYSKVVEFFFFTGALIVRPVSGEFANNLPDYQKIDIMMFVMSKVPMPTDDAHAG